MNAIPRQQTKLSHLSVSIPWIALSIPSQLVFRHNRDQIPPLDDHARALPAQSRLAMTDIAVASSRARVIHVFQPHPFHCLILQLNTSQMAIHSCPITILALVLSQTSFPWPSSSKNPLLLCRNSSGMLGRERHLLTSPPSTLARCHSPGSRLPKWILPPFELVRHRFRLHNYPGANTTQGGSRQEPLPKQKLESICILSLYIAPH